MDKYPGHTGDGKTHAANPNRSADNLSRRTVLAGFLGVVGTALVGCGELPGTGNRRPTTTGTAVPDPTYNNQVVRTPEQLQYDADRATIEGRNIIRLCIDTLCAGSNSPRQSYDDTTGITFWKNADGETAEDLPGPDVSVGYDPREGGSVTASYIDTVDDDPFSLKAAMLVTSSKNQPYTLYEIEVSDYTVARKITVTYDGTSGGIQVTYNEVGEPITGVGAVDTYNAHWDMKDDVGAELQLFEEARARIT